MPAIETTPPTLGVQAGLSPLPLPKWSAYFREHQPPMLIAWGKNDVIFPPPGARAYLKDLPEAELHFSRPDTSHSRITRP